MNCESWVTVCEIRVSSNKSVETVAKAEVSYSGEFGIFSFQMSVECAVKAASVKSKGIVYFV